MDQRLKSKTKAVIKGPILLDIVEIADKLFPFELAEKWDNCGIQIGDPQQPIHSVTFSLDATIEAIKFSIENKCQGLITHHPLLFDPIKSITTATITGRSLLTAAASRLSILSLHTNLDAAPDGLNDKIAGLLGLKDVIVPEGATCARLGALSKWTHIRDLALKVLEVFDLELVNIAAEDDRLVKKVFVVSGSGASFLSIAAAAGADILITGDVKYHAAIDAAAYNLPIIDATHFGLEKICVPLLVEAFEKVFVEKGLQIKCVPYYQKNPFSLFKP